MGCNPPANTHFCPIRTLTRGETATLFTRALGLSHNPQRIPMTEWTPVRCSKDGRFCTLYVETYSGRTHLVEEGLFHVLPFQAGEQAEFNAPDTSFTLKLNGTTVAMQQESSSDSGSASRMWSTTLVFSDGIHTLVGEWRWNGALVRRTSATLNVG